MNTTAILCSIFIYNSFTIVWILNNITAVFSIFIYLRFTMAYILVTNATLFSVIIYTRFTIVYIFNSTTHLFYISIPNYLIRVTISDVYVFFVALLLIDLISMPLRGSS